MDHRIFSRRSFAKAALLASAAWALPRSLVFGSEPTVLAVGHAPSALNLEHFPSRVHAFIFRNWPLVPKGRLAKVLNTTSSQVDKIAREMGLKEQPKLTPEIEKRSYLSVIKRNWHLLPYNQLLQLLNWPAEELNFILREDDFFFIKLGSLKPKCEPLTLDAPKSSWTVADFRQAYATVTSSKVRDPEPLFSFVRDLSAPVKSTRKQSLFSPRFCYSYFAVYGDPLLDDAVDPYPDGLLARLAESGVDGVWLQGLLSRLHRSPYSPHEAERAAERLRNLNKLAERAHKHGISIYVYLNEPRALPVPSFEKFNELKGVVKGDYAALCTSHPDVQNYLRAATEHVARSVPKLGGFFTITGSENLTNCWSHHNGHACPRCGKRAPAAVIAEVNRFIHEGIKKAGASAQLLVWDWGWQDGWVPEIIAALPQECSLMSVSEWSIPIERRGVKNEIGEYSISTIGPGPRAQRHWELARKRGLKTLAKIQAGNTWEIAAVPYIPALENVAQHAANLRDSGVSGLMLGWTLGGYPSPNLEVVAELTQPNKKPTVDEAMEAVAQRRFGKQSAHSVVEAWKIFSAAFREFPFNSDLVYLAPLQTGPSNLLWPQPTGYTATMVGIPYDDLNGWRANYPAPVFIAQFEKMASGFERDIERLKGAAKKTRKKEFRKNLEREIGIAEVVRLHYQSIANQARFYLLRNEYASMKTDTEKRTAKAELGRLLEAEKALALTLRNLQLADSRIGFEASNHYFYIPEDLEEKAINCEYLLKRWLPGL